MNFAATPLIKYTSSIITDALNFVYLFLFLLHFCNRSSNINIYLMQYLKLLIVLFIIDQEAFL